MESVQLAVDQIKESQIVDDEVLLNQLESYTCFSLDLSVWDSLCLLDLIDYFLFHVGEIFNYNHF